MSPSVLIWLPAGIAFVGIYQFGVRYFPAVFFGALFLALLRDIPVLPSLLISGGSTLITLTAVLVLKKTGFSPALNRVRDVAVFFGIEVIVASVLTSLIWVTVMYAFELLPTEALSLTWLSWSLNNAFGVLTLGPILLVWLNTTARSLTPRQKTEALILAGLFATCAFLVFHGNFAEMRTQTYVFGPHTFFPFFVWSALRFRQRGATLISVVSIAIVLVAVLYGDLPYPSLTKAHNLGYLLTFFSMLSVTTLFLAASVEQNKSSIESLSKNEINIRKREAEFRAMFELSGAGHCQLDPSSGKYLRINTKMAELLGYTFEELKNLTFQDITHPEDTFSSGIAFHRLVSGEVKEIALEKRYVRKDGSSIWAWVIATGIRDENDQLQSTLAVVQDITDRKIFEEELRKAKEIADSANISKTQFLANMSHEIRTPLGAILGFNEFSLDTNQTFEDRLNCAKKIKSNGDLLLRIIDDVLDLSKIEAGKLEIQISRIHLPKLLEDLDSMLRFKAEENAITLRIHSQGAIPTFIHSDPARLRQIFINIVGNAIKFSQGGKVDVSLKFSPSKHSGLPGDRSQDFLEFFVHDTGVGMAEDQAQSLFQPFHQADPSTTRRYGGTGLGLVLSRRFARALGGDVTLIDSKPHQGTTFQFWIASGTEAENDFYIHTDTTVTQVAIESIGSTDELSRRDAAQPKECSLSSILAKLELKDIRVLLVDDAQDNRFLFRRFLERAGAKVDQAENGRDAIELAEQGSHDIVLMDIQMPVMGGLEATTILRSKGYQKPILALTAHAMKEDRSRCIEAGCNDHISKPVNPVVLVEMVKRYAPQDRH